MEKTYTYLMTDGQYYKIGKSIDPVKRVKQLKTANINIELVCYGNKIPSKDMSTLMHHYKVTNGWFELEGEILDKCVEYITTGESLTEYTTKVRQKAKGKAKTSKIWGNGSTEHKLSIARGKKLANNKRDKILKDFETITIPMGKYKGELLKDCEDFNYLEWMLNTCTLLINFKRCLYYKIYSELKLKVG